MNSAGPNRRGGRPQLPLDIVLAMHAEYLAGKTFSEIKRAHGLRTTKLREVFVKRGLFVGTARMRIIDPKTGQFAKAKRLSARKIDELIASATRLQIPPELRLEWRSWSWERRADFIARLRARSVTRNERPKLPFSANVEPFDYCSRRAQTIAAALNAGLPSRDWVIHLKLCSQGVIWRDRLWFWVSKTGYVSGTWTPGHGRPELHRRIWEDFHGRAVPPSSVIRCLDRNPNNLAPENLVLFTRNDLVRENQAGALYRKARTVTALLLQQTQPTSSHDPLVRTLTKRPA